MKFKCEECRSVSALYHSRIMHDDKERVNELTFVWLKSKIIWSI